MKSNFIVTVGIVSKYTTRMKTITRLFKYISDIHLERRALPPRLFETSTKPYLILGGDIGNPSQESYEDFLLYASSKFESVFVLSGNHEYDGTEVCDYYKVDEGIRNICERRANLYYVQKNVHKILDSENIFLAGCSLWALNPRKTQGLHTEHVAWLNQTLIENTDKRFLITTHHCPSYKCIHKRYKLSSRDSFASNQEDLIKMKNVLGWIHGHSHYNNDIHIHGKLILSNQYGARLNPLSNYKH